MQIHTLSVSSEALKNHPNQKSGRAIALVNQSAVGLRLPGHSHATYWTNPAASVWAVRCKTQTHRDLITRVSRTWRELRVWLSLFVKLTIISSDIAIVKDLFVSSPDTWVGISWCATVNYTVSTMLLGSSPILQGLVTSQIDCVTRILLH